MIAELFHEIEGDPKKLRALWMNPKTWDALTANITMYPRTDGKTDCSFSGVPVFFNEFLADGMVVKIYSPFDAWMFHAQVKLKRD